MAKQPRGAERGREEPILAVAGHDRSKTALDEIAVTDRLVRRFENFAKLKRNLLEIWLQAGQVDGRQRCEQDFGCEMEELTSRSYPRGTRARTGLLAACVRDWRAISINRPVLTQGLISSQA